VFLIASTGGPPLWITHAKNGSFADSSWSPDGTEIALACRSGDSFLFGVCLINLKKGTSQRIVPATSSASNRLGGVLGWSSDGRLIVFYRMNNLSKTPRVMLRVVRPDGSGERALSADTRAFGRAWSPDGRTAVVQAFGDLEFGFVTTSGKQTIVRLHLPKNYVPAFDSAAWQPRSG
jgi:Tol biopolymer transport system component